jgi:hypothetical protein
MSSWPGRPGRQNSFMSDFAENHENEEEEKRKEPLSKMNNQNRQNMERVLERKKNNDVRLNTHCSFQPISFTQPTMCILLPLLVELFESGSGNFLSSQTPLSCVW